jgi:hypothetical protein
VFVMDGPIDHYRHLPPLGFETEWLTPVGAGAIVAYYLDSRTVMTKLQPKLRDGDADDELLKRFDDGLKLLVPAAARGDLVLRMCDDEKNYSLVRPDAILRAMDRSDADVPTAGLPVPNLRPLAVAAAELLGREVWLEEAETVFCFFRPDIDRMFQIEAETNSAIEEIFFEEWGGRFPKALLELPTANAASRARIETVERLARAAKGSDGGREEHGSSSRRKTVAEAIRPHLAEIQRRYRDGVYATNRPGENHRSAIPRMARDLMPLVNQAADGSLYERGHPRYRSLKSVQNQLGIAIRANPELWRGL